MSRNSLCVIVRNPACWTSSVATEDEDGVVTVTTERHEDATRMEFADNMGNKYGIYYRNDIDGFLAMDVVEHLSGKSWRLENNPKSLRVGPLHTICSLKLHACVLLIHT